MFKTAFKAVTIGFEVCEMVAISMGVLEAVKATFGLSELESLKFQNSGHISFKQSIYYARGVPKRMINAFLADPGGVLKATVGHLGKYNTIGNTLGDGIARIILA